jgi:hypothetical protein
MRELKYTLTLLLLAIAIGHAGTTLAQRSGGKLSVELDSKTLSVQAKAEELFEREEYRRAHIIYLKDLAPIGDKYAQYMLGFMTASGLGVEQDPVLASAWYRLAAERGEPGEFVATRDDLLDSLDEVDRERADRIYLELRRDYSDIAISMREAREEFDNLRRDLTGSRLGTTSSAMTIVEPRAGGTMSGDAFYDRAQRRLQAHLDNVTGMLGVERLDAETVTAGELANLDDQVRDYLGRTDTD